MTHTRPKARAVLLAALTVLSAFGGAVALGGTAAATSVDGAEATAVSAGEDLTRQRVNVSVDGSTGTVTLDYRDVPEGARIVDASVGSTDARTGQVRVSDAGDSVSFDVTGGSAGDVVVTLTWQTTDVDAGQRMTLAVSGDAGRARTVGVDVADLDAVHAFASGGSTFWAGQHVYFQARSAGTYQIRAVRNVEGSQDEVGTLVQEFVVDRANGTRLIDTGRARFEAGREYVVTDADRRPVATTPLGIESGRTDPSAAAWGIQNQTFAAQWAESEVTNVPSQDNEVDLEFASNRGSYDVTVAADGLGAQALREVFRGENVVAVDESDGTVTLGGVTGDGAVTGNFTRVDPDGYNFRFEVVDTGATARANVTVTADAGTLSLPTAVTEQRGDVAVVRTELTDTDTGYVQIGSAETGYNVTLEVADGGDGRVGIKMNTFYAGISAADGNWSNATPGWAPSTTRDRIEADLVYSLTEASDDDGDAIRNVWVHSNSLRSPIEAGTYDVVASTSAAPAPHGRYVESGDALTTFELQERTTHGVQMWRAPGDADYDGLPELLRQVNQTRTVVGGQDQSVGDLAVIQLQASGVTGYLLGGAAPPEDVYEPGTQRAYSEAHGFMLTVEAADPGPNRDAGRMALDSAAVEDLFVDDANNSVFLVVDPTASTDAAAGEFAFEAGEEYNATFEMNENNALIEADEDTAGREREVVGQTFSLVEPAAEFDRVTSDGVLEVPSTESARISGTTNLATGTELTVRLRNADGGQTFLTSTDVSVGDNGTFSTTVDVSDVDPGTEFTAVVRHGGTDVSDEYDGVVVRAETETATATATPVPTEEETPTEAATPAGADTATTTPTTATTTTTAADGTPTQTQQDTPGFGVAAALVALLGAALLAARRER